MNLFIIILLTNCAYLLSERVYKAQLRGLYKQELDRLVDEEVQNTFVSIYNKIIDLATNGVNEYAFTIMCEQSNYIDDSYCENYNGYKRWIQNHPNNIVSKPKSYVTREVFTTTIIEMLNYTFPDSNISKLHKYCCDYYQIEW
jgi:outer membrane protein assembly factor BamD (BamD/ComL family)